MNVAVSPVTVVHRPSTVDADISEDAWFMAHHGSAILDRAEQHLRKQIAVVVPTPSSILILRNARTDLRAVMDYLDGIAQVRL